MLSKGQVRNCVLYIFKDVLLGIIKGIKESLYGIYGLHFHYDTPRSIDSKCTSRDASTSRYKSSVKSRSRDLSTKREKELNVRLEVYKCSAYNGLSYGASVIVFNILFLQCLKFLLDYTLSQETASSVWSFINPALSVMFDILWTVPLFFISKIINAFWFQDIANSAYRQRYGRPQAFSISGIGSQISDTVFSIVIEALFLVQASLMQYVPYPALSLILSCVHFSLLNSLYSFEYLWCNKGWTFYKRISYIESNWPYFLGFGMPLSLVTFFLPSILQSGFVYSVCFPTVIISAIEAPPIRNENPGPPMKLFSVVVWLSSIVTKKLVSSEN